MTRQPPSLAIALILVVGLAESRAKAGDVQWSNISGGAFNVGGNWIGGVVPGAGDFARFGRTRNPDQHATYTVTFSTDPTNLGVVVEDDRVTFDLNGHVHLLSSVASAITVGTSSVAQGQLTIMDGTMAAIGIEPNAFIGTNGVSGTLIIGAGGLLLGPNLWVGGGGPGFLTIRDGGDFVGQDLLIGGLASSPGSAGITGTNSSALVDGGVGVGALSNGSLSLSAGGRLESIRGVLAQNAGITGTLSIDGAGSRWTTSEEAVVGHSGQATMNITAGGVGESHGLFLGVNPGSTGTATVGGPGSEWNNTTDIVVGDRGNGTLAIGAGGYVGTGSMNIARLAGNSAVSVSGTGATLGVGYELTVGGDRDLAIEGGNATLFIGPGGLVDSSYVYIYPNDVVELDGGALVVYKMYQHINSTGQLRFRSGILGARFVYFSVMNEAGRLWPRSFGETVIDGNYTQLTPATLEVDVDGPSQFEITQVHVSGTATLGGTLDVRLRNLFRPSPEEAISILDAASITGAFANAANGQRLECSNGAGSFRVHYGPNSPFDSFRVVLTDFRECIADFNRDGAVNLFDYLAFQTAFGNGDLSADLAAPYGVFNLFDYLAFQTAFGIGC